MEVNKLKNVLLSSDNLRNLVYEGYFIFDDVEYDIEIKDGKYEDSGRHQEYHSIIVYVKKTDQYFEASYSVSVKDEMGWSECNEDVNELVEVEPFEETVIKYKKK